MKLDPESRVSYSQAMKMRGRAVPRESRGQIIVQKWPEKRGPKKTEVQQAWVDRFSCIANVMKHPEPRTWDFANSQTKDSRWFIRDFFFAGAAGKLITTVGETRVTTPTFRVNRSAAEALTANITKTLTPNTLEWDNNQFWNSVTNPNRITFKSAGLYFIGAQVAFNQVTGGYRRIAIRLNNTTDLATETDSDLGNNATHLSVQTLYYFHANDYIYLNAITGTAAVTAQLNNVWGVAITPEAILP